MPQCVLLNADYTFLNLVNWRRAVCLLSKGKVEVLSYSETFIRTSGGALMKIPAVMKLVKLIRTIFRSRVPFSKKNVLIRVGFKCAYCGTEKEKLTIDHIVPRSKGGETTFENCVAACRSCNNHKGSRTPREIRKHLRVKPYQPTISEFIRLKIRKLGINNVLKDLGIF